MSKQVSTRATATGKPPLSRVRALAAAGLGLGFVALAVPQAQSLASQPRVVLARQAGLINHWTISPAGRQSPLGSFPSNAVLSPNGKDLLVSNSGAASPETVQVIDAATGRTIQTLPYAAPDGAVFGLAYSPDGTHAFASGGGFNTVHSYTVDADGTLTPAGDISLGSAQASIFPLGLAVTADSATLLVVNNEANTVSVVDIGTDTVLSSVPVGAYPYAVAISPDGRRAYVSNEQDATLSVLDIGTAPATTASAAAAPTISVKAEPARITVGKHPTAMVFGPGGRLYVADANSDAVSVVDTATRRVVRTISTAPYPGAPLSSSPVSLALDATRRELFAALPGENAVVAISLVSNRVIGRVPTAWYPTTVVLSRDRSTMFVTNGKGYGAGPNDAPGISPNPARTKGPFVDGYCNCAQSQYSGSMIAGTLSTVVVPDAGQLAVYTAKVARNDHVNDPVLLRRSPGNPIPVPGGSSPFKHVIYIDKENRTYDQVFGDERVGNGDPNLTLFGRAVTPNLHALGERFGLFDNFYADAEVSADGHNWINGAYASDYNEKMWVQDYSQGAGRNRGYDFEGDALVNNNPGGYLWDAAAAAGITYRDYGNFFRFATKAYIRAHARILPAGAAGTCPGPVTARYTNKAITIPAGTVFCFPAETVNPLTTPNLVGHIDPRYRPFDGDYPEAGRTAEWLREFKGYVAGGNLPQLELLRLPNDHTQGTAPGKLSPAAHVAENDLAVGQVVDAVSHSPYWKDTLIVVTEDDAQNGPDHVDAHRTTSLVISAYNAHAAPTVDHTIYDTAAMVRTIDLVLGLRPMSQYDAQATPMWRIFNSTADLTPYDARVETVQPTQLNTKASFGAAASASMDFSREDRAPAALSNSILWHAVKGAGTSYPVTHYAHFGAGDKE